MNSEDKEALYMILERNGRKEIDRVLDEIRAKMVNAIESGDDPYDIDLKGI